MLLIKNLKQKKFNKKLFHKFVESFRVVEFVNKQIYHLIFSNIYRVHSIFHVSLLKSYKQRDCDSAESFLSTSKLIEDNLKYKMKEILDRKTKNDKMYYKMKWLNYIENYNSWKLEHNLNNAVNLKREYNKKTKKKEERSNLLILLIWRLINLTIINLNFYLDEITNRWSDYLTLQLHYFCEISTRLKRQISRAILILCAILRVARLILCFHFFYFFIFFSRFF